MGLFDRFSSKDDEELEQEETRTEKKDSSPAVLGKAKKQFVIFHPDDASNDQLLAIADQLLSYKSVILNLEKIAKDARHFIDFLSGVAYAMQGDTKKIAPNTFLITPGGIEVTGEISESMDAEFKF